MNERAEQIEEALALARKMKAEHPAAEQIEEANLEIDYLIACSQLGYTDPDVLDYVKRELFNEREPFCSGWCEQGQ